MLEWGSLLRTCFPLGTLPETWEKYADMNEFEPQELPVILDQDLQTHDVYFRESTVQPGPAVGAPFAPEDLLSQPPSQPQQGAQPHRSSPQ
jgi:hypothetical protein